jgi:VWFA-related protein
MTRVLCVSLVLGSLLGGVAAGQTADSAQPLAVFRSGIDLVTINAVVRDQGGRVVTTLKKSDCYVVDTGAWRPIKDFRSEEAPISVALLFDASGSMFAETKFEEARRVARQFLAYLQPGSDELGLYSFDTGLRQLRPFSYYRADGSLERSLASVQPFGMTSLYDAIATTAREVAARPNSHRAVIVLTDGLDNNSRLTPAQVSAVASSIDVPVYILTVVAPIDRAGTVAEVNAAQPAATGNLSDLSRWTGGRLFVTSALDQAGVASKDIAEELRHQYVIAFEAGSRPGWHPIEVRVTDRHLTVRARSGYLTGQAQQVSLTQDGRQD